VIFEAAEATLRWLRDYHSHEVFGFENLPETGPALMIFHHSLATYDSFLTAPLIKDRQGRLLRGLADRKIFKTPIVGTVFTEMGFIDGTREGTRAILSRGELVGLAPGGMREALRSSREKYQFDWRGRLGFVWVSLLSGAPIVLAACPRSDDIYDVLPNPFTPWAYDKFRVPLPLFRGRAGISPLPRPIKLWHLLSEPIFPRVAPDQVQQRDVEQHHAYLTSRMKRLMEESLRLGPMSS
jgi:1-acyl-sn-glycerol-3-phosphate acyltransferase